METIYGLALGLCYVVLGLIVLILAKAFKDVLTPFAIDEELTRKDNHAVGLAVTGYFAGVIIIFLGASIGPEFAEDVTPSEFLRTLGVDFLYAIGGIVALNLGRLVVDKLVLYKFSTVKEIITDRNVGTGAVEFGCYVATALIVAGAIHGEGGGILSALVFFVLGQLVLVIFALFYQWITRYDIHREIERDNVAAGVALGGNMAAIGVILLKATSGDFVDWTTNLTDFVYYALAGFVTLMLLRWVTDWVLLPNATIPHEIAEDQNLNAAWIESIVAVGLSSVIFFML
jgi:uncharacterized membrane protein YjfL (UPF0719 family)